MNKRFMFLFCSILFTSLSAEEVCEKPEAQEVQEVQEVVAQLVRKEIIQNPEELTTVEAQ